MTGVQIFLSLSDDDRIVEFASFSHSAQFDFKIVVPFTFAVPLVIVECPKKSSRYFWVFQQRERE